MTGFEAYEVHSWVIDGLVIEAPATARTPHVSRGGKVAKKASVVLSVALVTAVNFGASLSAFDSNLAAAQVRPHWETHNGLAGLNASAADILPSIPWAKYMATVRSWKQLDEAEAEYPPTFV